MVKDLYPLLPMLVLLAWAAIEDFRSRRIRNWLTLSLAVTGLTASFLPSSTITPAQSGLGMLAGFGLLFVLFLIRAVGGGDVKLVAGVGAWVGFPLVLKVLVIEAIVGLVIVLVQCACTGKLFALFRNSAVVAISLAHIEQLGADTTAELGKSCRSIDRPLPYSVPVLVAVILVVLLPL